MAETPKSKARTTRWGLSRALQSYRLKHGLALAPVPGAFQVRGVRAHKAKLTDAQVAEIRRRRKAGVPCIALAREYKVSRQAIYDVLKERSWKRALSLDDFEPG